MGCVEMAPAMGFGRASCTGCQLTCKPDHAAPIPLERQQSPSSGQALLPEQPSPACTCQITVQTGFSLLAGGVVWLIAVQPVTCSLPLSFKQDHPPAC